MVSRATCVFPKKNIRRQLLVPLSGSVTSTAKGVDFAPARSTQSPKRKRGWIWYECDDGEHQALRADPSCPVGHGGEHQLIQGPHQRPDHSLRRAENQQRQAAQGAFNYQVSHELRASPSKLILPKQMWMRRARRWRRRHPHMAQLRCSCCHHCLRRAPHKLRTSTAG